MKIFVDHIVGEEKHCLCVSEDLSAGGMSILGEVIPVGENPTMFGSSSITGKGEVIRALGELRYERKHPTDRGFAAIDSNTWPRVNETP